MIKAVSLYIITTYDKAAFVKWSGWIARHGKPLQYYYCDDGKNEVCNIGRQAGFFDFLEKRLYDHNNRPCNFSNPLSRFYCYANSIGTRWVNYWFINELAQINNGYELHLIGVHLLFYRIAAHNHSSYDKTAHILAQRAPRNPFFQYLAQRPKAEVEKLVLELCPRPGNQLGPRFQWAWERSDSQMAWKKSVLWDCLFMANLLSRR